MDPSSPIETSITDEDSVQDNLVEDDPLADIQIVAIRTISAEEFDQENLISDDDDFQVLEVVSMAIPEGADAVPDDIDGEREP